MNYFHADNNLFAQASLERTAQGRESEKKSLPLAALSLAFIIIGLSACAGGPVPGPDKQAAGTISGAAIGAGSGAIWGAQVAAATGPAALAGAGLGAVFGALNGLGIDILEEDQLYQGARQAYLEEVSWAQSTLASHYKRRVNLHPGRDIFPADWFFEGDSTDLRKEAIFLLREVAQMTQGRAPESRIVVASYSVTKDPGSSYAKYLNKERSTAIAKTLIKHGVSSRRVFTRSVPMEGPLLLDPNDDPSRYRQAIEIIPLDL